MLTYWGILTGASSAALQVKVRRLKKLDKTIAMTAAER